ncbi:MAG: DUF4440 domain-containing protein [Verrucomicrobiia bacterium]
MNDTREAISLQNQRFMAEFQSGNSRAIAELYTADAQVLAPGMETLAGSASIQGFWTSVMSMGVKQVSLNTREVEDLGEAAVETGAFELRGSAGQVLDHGKYLVVWKRQDGHWKLHRDIWNTNRSPGQ